VTLTPTMKTMSAGLFVEKANPDLREITGVATTPAVDLAGDVINPLGVKHSLPLPLLWQHTHALPAGRVTAARVTKAGIHFTAKVASIDEAGTLKDKLDEYWQSVKAGLVTSVSIGFLPKKATPMKGGGWLFDEWIWTELSLCTIPCNPEAVIQSHRTLEGLLAASKAAPTRIVRLDPPKRGRVVRL
jgi:HK97 family phage prohead protease